MKISEDLLAILTCPVSGGTLDYNIEQNMLISKQANLAYPIIDGIPLLLESEATKLTDLKIMEPEEA